MENPENNQVPEQAPKTPKKIVKKKVVSGYGYGGGYGGYGYGGGYGSYGSYGGYGYGGGYGGYGYGGGYGAQGGYGSPAGGGVPNRTFKDYARILWERIWYIIITFFVIFAGVLLYTFRITPVYTSAATVQVLRDSDATIEGPGSATQSMNTRVVNVEDFNTQVKILESNEIIKAVRSRMKEEDVKRFMAPYQDMFTWGPAKTEFEILAENRTVIPERMSLIIRVIYTHPDAQVAADIANLFAGEYISYTHQLRVKKMMDSIDELRTKVAQQTRHLCLEVLRVRFIRASPKVNEQGDRLIGIGLPAPFMWPKRAVSCEQANGILALKTKCFDHFVNDPRLGFTLLCAAIPFALDRNVFAFRLS